MQDIFKKSAIALTTALGTAAAVAQPFPQQPGSFQGPWLGTPLPPVAVPPPAHLYRPIPNPTALVAQECQRMAPMMQERAKDPVIFYISPDNSYACQYQKMAQNAPYTNVRGYPLPQQQQALNRDMKQQGIPTTPLEQAMMDACNSLAPRAQPIRTDGRGTTLKSYAENGSTGCVWDYKNGHRLDGIFNLHTPDGRNDFRSTLNSYERAENSMMTYQRERERRAAPHVR